jgi:hypothetical protein
MSQRIRPFPDVAINTTRISSLHVDPESLKLAEEIEASRQEIEKLQERVRQLVARRGKRAELVKSTHALTGPELPDQPALLRPALPTPLEEIPAELNIHEGLEALKNTAMSEVRLIAFKHGAIILLFANEKSMSIRMDDRGPKPLLDILTANEAKLTKPSGPHHSPADSRSRA